MKSKYTLILFLLINCLIFSQDKKENYYRNILLSFKAGYHTGYNLSMDEGFPVGIVYDGSIALGISKNIILGINFDYWKKDNVVTHPSLTNITINKNYKGFGYRFYVQYRNTFLNKLDLYIDAGVGRYKISTDYLYNNSYSANNNYYLNAGLSIGAGYKFSKFISLNAEISHYLMIDFDLGGSSSVYTTNFKFGPTFFIQLK